MAHWRHCSYIVPPSYTALASFYLCLYFSRLGVVSGKLLIHTRWIRTESTVFIGFDRIRKRRKPGRTLVWFWIMKHSDQQKYYKRFGNAVLSFLRVSPSYLPAFENIYQFFELPFLLAGNCKCSSITVLRWNLARWSIVNWLTKSLYNAASFFTVLFISCFDS